MKNYQRKDASVADFMSKTKKGKDETNYRSSLFYLQVTQNYYLYY